MKNSVHSVQSIALLCLIPIAWAFLAKSGKLDKLENALLDLRLQFRGELSLEETPFPALSDSQTPPKLIYVDFDQQAISSPEIGERPWDREIFAKAGNYLLDEKVGARAIGYDFIFSQNSSSRMVPEESILRSNRKLGELVKAYPEKVVLGAHYTSVSFEFKKERISGLAPLLYEDYYKKELNLNYPEGPTYPICFYQDDKLYGRQGILMAEMGRSHGPVPRWVPLYFPAEGDAFAKNLLLGHKFAHPIEVKEQEAEQDMALNLESVEELAQASQALGYLQSQAIAFQQASEELSQLEEVAKEDPDSAEELKELIAVQKATTATAEKNLKDAFNAVGGGEELPNLTVLIALLDTDTKLTRLQLQLAEQQLESTLLLEDYLQVAPFHRQHLSFAKDFENNHWQLKDGDNIVKSVPAARDNQKFYHMSIELILATYGLDWSHVATSSGHLTIKDQKGQVLVDAPLVEEQLIETNWFSQWRQPGRKNHEYLQDPYNPRCSLYEVLQKGEFFFNDQIQDAMANFETNLAELDESTALLKSQVAENPDLKEEAQPRLDNLARQKKGLLEAKEDFDQAQEFFTHFKDAMVLVGPVDPTFQDLAPTPFDETPVPKVGFIGNTIKTLLSGQYIQRSPTWVNYAAIVGLSLPLLYLRYSSEKNRRWFRPVGIALVFLYPLVTFLLFKSSHTVLPVSAPTGSTLTLMFAMLAIRKG